MNPGPSIPIDDPSPAGLVGKPQRTIFRLGVREALVVVACCAVLLWAVRKYLGQPQAGAGCGAERRVWHESRSPECGRDALSGFRSRDRRGAAGTHQAPGQRRAG